MSLTGPDCANRSMKLYGRLFYQLIYRVMLECNPSLNQVLLQLWQNKITLNSNVGQQSVIDNRVKNDAYCGNV